ncbi:YeeE/YedE family protein [Labrys sp. ZIDIC5]|uniref:YeeE/YedE family protein n=1 Tax=Labrys sedimenti TaxID=3106036 RepID=UPI002ACA080E|nr:YeeE/YedE family protein [Labrys sp. ZIDIC5]MDZ5451227.1 YeeE/YedE family protein [Labrys sp. ZIDIC5]
MRGGDLFRPAVSLVAGMIFGLGLAISGMIDPARVLGFLNVASGHWDPSLVFVLAGAVLVAITGVFLQRRLSRPWLGERFHLPATTRIDRPLLLGALLFGVGWGLAGFCPGPAIAALSTARPVVLLFVAAMILGMLAWSRLFAKAGD